MDLPPIPQLPPLTKWEKIKVYFGLLLDNNLDKLEVLVRKIWLGTLGRVIFVKRSRYPDIEVASMRFVRKHTTIPVPRVFCVLPYRRGSRYIFMSRVSGRDLYPEKYDALPREHREVILSQLRSFINQLRSIGPAPSTPPLICSVLGGPVLDHRISVTGPYGPYYNEEHMNLQIRLGDTVEGILAFQGCSLKFAPTVDAGHALRHPIVFTHNDIALRNIMVDGLVVTGLIDWECAGWFPAHWEYVKAHWCSLDEESLQFDRDLREFIPPYDLEHEVDALIGWGRSWQPDACKMDAGLASFEALVRACM